jgi:hypothetical protein
VRFQNQDVKPKIYTISKTGKRKLLMTKKIGEFVAVSGVHTKFYLKSGIYENYVYNDLKVNKKEE